MKEVKLIRNIGLFGHSKCGKTTMAEAMLFTAGAISRLGRVDNGTANMDFEAEEISHKMSINTAFHHLSWNKHEVYLSDTPGDENFLHDAMFTAQVVDGAIFTIGAVLGVKTQTERIAGFVLANHLPTLIFINKMNRERADFAKTVADITANLAFKPAVIQLPIGAEDKFRGVIDLISQQAYIFADNGRLHEAEIPPDMTEEAAAYHEALMEAVAETDDNLIETFLEEGELSKTELQQGLIKAVRSAKLQPIITGAANIMTAELFLNAITDLLPSPADREPRAGINPQNDEIVEFPASIKAPFSALVFKTMADPYAGRLSIFRVISGTLAGDSFHNAGKDKDEKFGQLMVPEGKSSKTVDEVGPGMIAAVAKLKYTTTGDTLCEPGNQVIFELPEAVRPSLAYAVTAGKKDDEDKLFSSISKMLEEDPTLRMTRDAETNETIIAGTGKNHLQITCEKIKRKFGVDMHLQLPKIPYKETISGKAKVQYKHKKQSGGRGQYADCWLEIEPQPRGKGYEFKDCIVGGVIPKQYIPAVDKGIQEAMAKGVLAGYPVVDVSICLVDGSFHNVDSSEMAFKIAGSMALKKGAMEAGPLLLEPIMRITITIPEDKVGDIIGDLNSRRGKVMGMASDTMGEIINAEAPMAEILEYGPELAALTRGLGFFASEFSHYQEVPSQISEKIISKVRE